MNSLRGGEGGGGTGLMPDGSRFSVLGSRLF